MISAVPTVTVVDDDDSVRRALTRLLTTSGYLVRSFSSATDLLADATPRLPGPGCLLLDVRLPGLGGLELHCRDLADRDFSLAPVALVHAALIFEHVGLGHALQNAVSLVASGGRLSVVLQLPSQDEQGVASTNYTSMQKLKQDFVLIDIAEFQHLLEQKGFQLVQQERRSLPAGKALWLGVFARGASPVDASK